MKYIEKWTDWFISCLNHRRKRKPPQKIALWSRLLPHGIETFSCLCFSLGSVSASIVNFFSSVRVIFFRTIPESEGFAGKKFNLYSHNSILKHTLFALLTETKQWNQVFCFVDWDIADKILRYLHGWTIEGSKYYKFEIMPTRSRMFSGKWRLLNFCEYRNHSMQCIPAHVYSIKTGTEIYSLKTDKNNILILTHQHLQQNFRVANLTRNSWSLAMDHHINHHNLMLGLSKHCEHIYTRFFSPFPRDTLY